MTVMDRLICATGAKDVVYCDLFANEPNYSGGKITAGAE
jgi:hypothetical protein